MTSEKPLPKDLLALKQSRSRNRVRLLVVLVIKHTRIIRLIGTRKAYQPAGHDGRARPSDLQLMASAIIRHPKHLTLAVYAFQNHSPWIELRTANIPSTMQRNDLVSHKVIPCLEAFGDRVVYSHVGNSDQRSNSPDILEPIWVGTVKSVFLDLEPNSFTTRLVLIAACGINGRDGLHFYDCVHRRRMRYLRLDISPYRSRLDPGGFPATTSIGGLLCFLLRLAHAVRPARNLGSLLQSTHRIQDRQV
jgi:hypothetical protein